MKRILRLALGCGLSYVLFLVVVWFAVRGLSDRPRVISFSVLAVLGALVACVVAWYLWRRVPSGVPTDDEVAQLFAAAGSYLSSAPATRGQSVRTTPAVIVLGKTDSAKTTLIARSPFDSVLLAGRVRRDDDGAPPATTVGNVWYTQRALILEAGGPLIGDADRWPNFVRRLLPARGFSALFKGVQASRVAVVCLSCEDLIQPNAGEGLAKTVGLLHAAISDLSTSIGVRLPVYVVFTKADRIPGFAEAVSVLTRGEATEVIGASFPIVMDEPSGLYTERQSKLLTQRFMQLYHSFALDRTRILSRGSDPERRAVAYEFAREFRKLIPPAVQFLVDLCRPNPLRASAFLRGFYFVGVRPIVDGQTAETTPEPDTSIPAVGGATAVLSGAAVAAELAKRTLSPASGRRKPQWVFLDRLFSEVILADDTALGLTSQGKRVDLVRRGAAAAAAVVAFIFLIGTTISFASNFGLETRVARAMADVSQLSPDADGGASIASLRRLDSLRLVLNDFEPGQDGIQHKPLHQRWGLYSGERLLGPARQAYFAAFDRLLLSKTRTSLERRLSGLGQAEAAGAVYDSSYDALKAYLIVTDFPDSSTAPVSVPLISAWKDQKAVGKEELDLANEQFVYYASTLPHFRLEHPKANPQVVEVARRYVNQFANGQRVYQVMVEEASKVTKPFSFPTAYPTATDVIRDPYVVPGAFTRDGWKVMHTELGRIAKYTMAAQWVTGDARRVSPSEQDSLKAFVTQQYVADFATHWRTFLRSATLVGAGTLQGESKHLQTLSSPSSPLLRLLAVASQNTSVDTGVLGNRFQAVRAVVPAATGDVLIQPPNAPYMTALAELGNSAAAAADAKAADDMRAAAKKVADAASQLSQTFRPDPDGDVDRVVKALLDAPARTVSGLAQGVTAVEAAARDFCATFMNVANRYPINPDSGDVSLTEFTNTFHPTNGTVVKLLHGPLRDVVAVQGTKVTRRPDAAYPVSPLFLVLLSKSLEIGQTFYSQGSSPSFIFNVRGRPGVDVPRITLALDGQAPVVWSAGATQPRDMTWNVASGRQADLTGRYGTDQDLALRGSGQWGLLRLFGQARRPTPDVFEWPIDLTTAPSQGSGRAIQLQVDRGQNVLSRGIFSGLRQCAMIDR